MTTNQKIGSAAITGLIIGLLIAFLAFILFRPKVAGFMDLPSKLSPGPVNMDTANKGIEAYRDPDVFEKLDAEWQGKVNGIVYDSLGFFKNYSEVFQEFVRSHELDKPYERCKWRLGMYLNVVYAGKKKYPKLNVYLIPTVQDTLSGYVYEYYEIKDDDDSPYKPSSKPGPNDGYIYDQGTLFP